MAGSFRRDFASPAGAGLISGSMGVGSSGGLRRGGGIGDENTNTSQIFSYLEKPSVSRLGCELRLCLIVDTAL
jgi:hypothetical protein